MTKTKASPDESVTASTASDGRFAVAEHLDNLAYDIEAIASGHGKYAARCVISTISLTT